jgi:2-polyprenyl-3-methyl-5-hydroxy-6-metoxy-1,4-benzoquinol methylase
MSKEKWNEHYGAEEYHYGVEPNAFLREELAKLQPGKILFPAEGEGRNAVYAATCGWDVFAFDQSEKGQEKALKLALGKCVTIDYAISELQDWQAAYDQFDAIALIFVHMPHQLRKEVHQKMIQCLKPGGTLILEAFNKRQIKHNSGGPRDIEMLQSAEILKDDLSALKTIFLEELTTTLQEGRHHEGLAEVVRFVGKKL